MAIRRTSQPVFTGSLDMGTINPPGVGGTALGAASWSYSAPIDTRYAEAVGIQAVWQGLHGSGSFFVSASVPDACIVAVSTETFTSTTGSSSGTLWNTGTDVASAAINLATCINSASTLVSASVSGSTVLLASKLFGTAMNYALSSSDVSVSRSAATMVSGNWPTGAFRLQTSNNYNFGWDRTYTEYSGTWDTNATAIGSAAGTASYNTTFYNTYAASWCRIAYSGTSGAGAGCCWLICRG